ncbi:MAG: heme-binding domain-containing protein [Saprospiraceae bacterium]
MLRKILLVLIPLFIIMQFYRIDKTNPPVDVKQDFVATIQPPATMTKMLKEACYDCHSHETEYPWYTEVMPFSKWILGHIIEGRKELNFSAWTSYPADEKKHLLKECAEVLVEKRMPLTPYLITHSEARITKEQRKELADWFESIK